MCIRLVCLPDMIWHIVGGEVQFRPGFLFSSGSVELLPVR